MVSPHSGLHYNQGGPSGGLYYNQGGPSQWSLLRVVFITIMVVPHQWSLLKVVFITVRVFHHQWFLLRVVFHHRFTVLTYLGLLWVNVFSPKNKST